MRKIWHLPGIAALTLAAHLAAAVESDPLPVPSTAAGASAVVLYNEGVALLVARKYQEAQLKFEAALAVNEKLPEAHNNLAYALRMQGPHNFSVSLAHYDRALALKPDLAQAYMYRGMLFVLQGNTARAREDLTRLKSLHPVMGGELERALDGGATSDRDGIAAQY